MDVSILIISYNTRELTLACLGSVYGQTRDAAFEVIVVDNTSADGSADAIEAAFPQVRLIRAGENLGFAQGNNVAVLHARGRYLLLLNPDTVVLDGAIDKLYAFAQANPQYEIVGGRTVFDDGSLNPKSCWRRPTLWSAFCIAVGLTAAFPRSNLFARESYGSWRRDTVREVDIVSGCFFMLKRSLWEELGGFDPAFFMYGEEADLCLRAAKRGVRCAVTPDATIVHYGGASEPVRADKVVRLFRAKAQLFRRHWSPVSAPLGVLTLDLWALTRVLAFAALSTVQPRRREQLQSWVSVRRRRKEWWSAQAPPPANPTPPQAPVGVTPQQSEQS